MSAQGGRPHEQTLSAWLATLGSGDLCPWCGARLQIGPVETGIVRLERTLAATMSAWSTLVCRRCGAEVEWLGRGSVEGRAEKACMLHDAA